MRFARTLPASATILLIATPDFAAAQSAAFDVPREPVARAIRRISQQAGGEIIVAGDAARGRMGNAIASTMDVEEALSRLVAGTGLEARKTGERRFVLVRAEDDPIRAAPVETPEIIVTAEKRSQRIEDVPLAVSVLAGSEAADRGVASFSNSSMRFPACRSTMPSVA